MLRKIRISIAIFFFTLITLLFLDFTGTLHAWFGWMTQMQFLPALVSNAGIILFLVLLTLLLGRVYCSVICPLGVFQDIMARIGRRGKKLPYTFSRAKSWLRYSVLAVFLLGFILHLNMIVALLDPYAAYGRIVNNFFLPVVQWGNNLLAYLAERADSYAFYKTDVWMKSLPTLIVAGVSLIVVVVLVWRNGRTYCNTICPVGTLLGFVSRYSLFKIRLDSQKCNKCGLCARNCKSSCIDYKALKVDHSRCVSCMNCIEKCKRNAIGFIIGRVKQSSNGFPVIANASPVIANASPVIANEVKQSRNASPVIANEVKQSRKKPGLLRDKSLAMTEIEGQPLGRKAFLSGFAILASTALKAQIIPKATDIKTDGGLADILPKKSPYRQTPIFPAGSLSDHNMKRHCTACQLCVTVCPTSVLRPSNSLSTFMQPILSFERGYCRPECVKCSEICPGSAIHKLSKEEKSSIQIGHAVWRRGRCIPVADEQECNNCERHCPTKAITMVPIYPRDENSLKVPAINEELCIGCGACEYLCPSRPYSAIFVIGHPVHKLI